MTQPYGCERQTRATVRVWSRRSSVGTLLYPADDRQASVDGLGGEPNYADATARSLAEAITIPDRRQGILS